MRIGRSAMEPPWRAGNDLSPRRTSFHSPVRHVVDVRRMAERSLKTICAVIRLGHARDAGAGISRTVTRMSPEALGALRRMWPNREHESNWLKAALCSLGFHRWHTLTLDGSSQPRTFDFCRWCPRPNDRKKMTHRSVTPSKMRKDGSTGAVRASASSDQDCSAYVLVTGTSSVTASFGRMYQFMSASAR